MKTKLLLTSLISVAINAPAWAQDAWPQPESAYSSTQPRAQWLTPPEPAASQPPALPSQPQYGYGPQAPAYGYGYQAAPPQGYAPQAGYYGYGYRPYYPPQRKRNFWQRWQPNHWPRWDNFSMPSPSVSLPSFSFPTGPFGW